MCRFKTRLALCAGVAAILATPSHAQEAQADEDTGGITDIVVTAQRRAEKAQATPLAITAIGGSDLQSKGVFETADLSAVVPNMQIISPYGRAQPNISLRGISVANEYNANQASPIGVYIDDAYMASRTSHGMQLYDLERVEVLRGPQGTLYGRNTTGGAVNFITMRPKLDGTSGFVEVGYGKFNRVEASGALDATLVPDKVGIRIAGNYIKSDGMVKNLVPGGQYLQSEDSLGVRVSLLAKPSEDFTLFAKFYHGKDKPWQVGNHFIGATPTGVSPLTGYSRGSLGFYEVQANNPGKFEFDGTGSLLNLSYNTGDWCCQSTAGYRGKMMPQAANTLRRVTVTSFDVAAHANVSQSTVSKALRGDPGIRSETRKRVVRAAEALGYCVDARASSLRSLRADCVAVILVCDQVERLAEELSEGAYLIPELQRMISPQFWLRPLCSKIGLSSHCHWTASLELLDARLGRGAPP